MNSRSQEGARIIVAVLKPNGGLTGVEQRLKRKPKPVIVGQSLYGIQYKLQGCHSSLLIC